MEGYRRALGDAGAPIDERLIVTGDFTYDVGYRAARELLAQSPRPTAILAQNDDMAAAAIAAARDLGLPQSGVGAEIVARLMEHAFDYLDAPVLRITGKDVPMPYAANLEKLALPSVAEVVQAVKAVCYR